MLGAAELTNELLKLRKIWPDVAIEVAWQGMPYHSGYDVEVRVPSRFATTRPLHHAVRSAKSYEEVPKYVLREPVIYTQQTGFREFYTDMWPAQRIVHDVAGRITSYMLEN